MNTSELVILLGRKKDYALGHILLQILHLQFTEKRLPTVQLTISGEGTQF
jgi:hypothetical protein